MRRTIYALIILMVSVSLFAQTKLITYPVPESEKALSCYHITVNGKQVDCYKALSPQFWGGEYYFCYFDFEGEVEVKIYNSKGFYKILPYTASPQDKSKAAEHVVGEVMPRSINAKITKNHIVFKQNKPFKAIITRNERGSGQAMPLIIFGNPIEKNVPKKDDPNVLYYDKGVHYSKKPIALKDNQTLYLAGGAVLKAPVITRDAKNLKICGRGVISFDNRERESTSCIRFYNCQNITVDGVIIKDSCAWTLAFFSSTDVLVNNLKICASRMINDDAIDLCNTSNVKIFDTFCRAQDDIVAIKGYWKSGEEVLKRKCPEGTPDRLNNLPVENVLIENCIFWTDNANVFRIGYECYAPTFRNIRCKNLFIPFYSQKRKPEELWTHALAFMQVNTDMTMEDIHFDGIEIRSNGVGFNLVVGIPHRVRSGEARAFGTIMPYGNIKNCSFKNINVYGAKTNDKDGHFEILLQGRTPEYMVKNIAIENVKILGEKLTEKSPNVKIGKFTENITIK